MKERGILMKTIAFFNVKGGCGKTTSCINISYILATKYEKKVLLIDLDPQANSSDFFIDQDYDTSIEDVFVGRKNIKECILHTKYDRLDIIPSTITLSRTEKAMVANTTEPQQLKLAAYLGDIETDYDYCILDCSPSAETITNINGLAAANAVFVPLKADKWTIKGLQYTLSIIQTVKKYNYKLTFGGAFFVQKENRRVNKGSEEVVTEMIGKNYLLPGISKGKAAEESSYAAVPVLLYDKRSSIAKDYVSLVEHILKIV